MDGGVIKRTLSVTDTQEKEASRLRMRSAVHMLSRGEGAVTSTFGDVHPVARHRSAAEKSLPPVLALCYHTKGLMCLPATF